MATDSMKPEMIRILKAMFSVDGGKMEIKQVETLLNLPNQQTLYHIEELIRKKLVERLILNRVTYGSNPGKFYHLTPEGRAYVMENLMSDETH